MATGKLGHLHVQVATARDGSILYCDRDWRMGGRDYRVKLPDGRIVNGTNLEPGKVGRALPPPNGGRWSWSLKI